MTDIEQLYKDGMKIRDEILFHISRENQALNNLAENDIACLKGKYPDLTPLEKDHFNEMIKRRVSKVLGYIEADLWVGGAPTDTHPPNMCKEEEALWVALAGTIDQYLSKVEASRS